MDALRLSQRVPIPMLFGGVLLLVFIHAQRAYSKRMFMDALRDLSESMSILLVLILFGAQRVYSLVLKEYTLWCLKSMFRDALRRS
jgi:hypothetical protein